MKSLPPLALWIPVLLLVSCKSVRPYSEKREQQRVEQRDEVQTAAQVLFEEGKQAGQRDKALGDPNNYHRHSPLYTPATEAAFADGYREGYGP